MTLVPPLATLVSASMRPAIFIDFYGTLSSATFWGGVPRWQRKLIDRELFGQGKDLVQSWMRGELNAREVCAVLASRTGMDASYLWSTLLESLESIAPLQVITRELTALQKHHLVFLVSDNMDVFVDHLLPRPEFQNCFSAAWVSSSHKRLKVTKGQSAFEELAKIHDLDLANSLLIDDSDASIECFASLGGAVYQTVSPLDTLHVLHQLRRRQSGRSYKGLDCRGARDDPKSFVVLYIRRISVLFSSLASVLVRREKPTQPNASL